MTAAYPLPEGWEIKTLGEIFDVIGGGTPSTKITEYWTGNIPWITSADIYGLKDIRPRKKITEQAVAESATNLVPAGSIIVVTRVSLGKVALVPYSLAFSQDSQALINKGHYDINIDFALYYLSLAAQTFKYKSRGTTISGITKKQLKDIPIPLPPLPEQERIVEKIEALFTQLDAGTASLRRIQAQLKRYRASVLKAAVEGRLVPQDPSDEPAEQILRRLGKSPLANKDLRNLPEGWCWTTLQNISWKADYGTSQKCDYSSSTTPVIRIPNIVHGEFDFSDLKYATKPEELKEDKALIPNDFLIIRTNGSKELIGRSCLVRNQFKQRTFFASYLIRYRLSSCSEWISTIWSSELIRSQIERIAATSAGQYNISISSLNRTLIPLPPIEEQRRIVAEVERRLSLATEVEKAVETALARAERLRQAILKQAFEGRLLSRAGAAQAQVESTLAAAHRSIPSTDEVNP